MINLLHAVIVNVTWHQNMRLAKVLIVVFSFVVSNVAKTDFFDEIIKDVNSQDGTWKAGHNHITAMAQHAVDVLGTRLRPEGKRSLPTRFMAKLNLVDLPKSFDSRENWHDCRSIWSIKDQGKCGSCWAVSSASVMSDRVCIASGGQTQVNISAEYLTACCTDCGVGCNGGYPDIAWQFYLKNGIVTGGDYHSQEGCQPYEVQPSHSDADIDLMCHPKHCTNKNYNTPFKKDLHYGRTAYFLPNDEKAIQAEILTNGPVAAGFTVYMDFLAYKSGVYKHTSGGLAGGHAVRMLGWGVENGVNYWLIANSWNRTWGENGYFKIIRGVNNCGIEEFVTAGLVKPN